MEKRDWLMIAAVAGILYVAGQYVASQPQRVQQEVQANREITVQGSGKVFATPNVAKYTVSITTGPQRSAEAALARLSQLSDPVVSAIKKEGVEERDIATINLSINPIYDYTNGRQDLRGFEASQLLELTIRDLDKIGIILAKVTGEGVNAAGGLRFEVDNLEEVRLEAQKKAIEDAKQKAEQLAKTLGVNLGRVKTFAASEAGRPPVPYFAKAADAVGGEAVPEVPAGTQEIQANVTVTFELQ